MALGLTVLITVFWLNLELGIKRNLIPKLEFDVLEETFPWHYVRKARTRIPSNYMTIKSQVFLLNHPRPGISVRFRHQHSDFWAENEVHDPPIRPSNFTVKTSSNAFLPSILKNVGERHKIPV
jgi:hypothetical protein